MSPAREAAGLAIVVLLGLIAARYFTSGALPFLVDVSPEGLGRFWPRRGWLLPHIVAGSVALLVGPLQFWSGLTGRPMRLHRWTGRLYVAGVAVGGAAAFQLAAHTDAGASFAVSLGAMGSAWWMTTALAYVAIRRGRLEQHREWVVRSYVVTFTFVTFRAGAELGVLPHLGREPVATLIWLSWTLPLLVTEAVLQGRKVFARNGA